MHSIFNHSIKCMALLLGLWLVSGGAFAAEPPVRVSFEQHCFDRHDATR